MSFQKKEKNSAWIDIAVSILISVCLIVAIYEAYVILQNRASDRKAMQEYEALQEYVSISDPPAAQETAEEKTEPEEEAGAADDAAEEGTEPAQEAEPPRDYPGLSVDYEELKKINPDFVGWLYVPAVDISYPVVQETYPDQYLYNTFEGKKNNAGCLFMDDVSDRDFNGFYDFIFGHNMKNGSMFGSLRRLHEKGNEHLAQDEPYLYIYRQDKIMRYRIYSYYITENGSPAYDEIYDHEAYDRIVEYTVSNSMIEAPDMKLFEKYPEILTMSTCSGRSGGSQRFVVHAVKVATWNTR